MGQNPIIFGAAESKIGIHDTTTSPTEHVPGILGQLPDGRKFRWAKADGSGFAAGIAVVSVAATTANHANMNCAATPVGSFTVDVTLGATAATVNQYQHGWLWVNDGTGEGHMYRVASHPLHAGSGTLTVTLADAIKVALVASGTSQVTLVANPYNGVATAGATPAGKLAGVSPVAFAANAYGWIQTSGPASVLEGGTDTVAGDLVTSAASGACALATNVIADLHVLGVCHSAQSASGDQALVWLSLE